MSVYWTVLTIVRHSWEGQWEVLDIQGLCVWLPKACQWEGQFSICEPSC